MTDKPHDMAAEAAAEEASIEEDSESYSGLDQNEKRRIYAVEYAGTVCENSKEIKQMALWIDRFLKDGKGGPIKD